MPLQESLCKTNTKTLALPKNLSGWLRLGQRCIMIADYIQVGKVLWFLCGILIAVAHLDDTEVDPSTLDVGSPEWAAYVRQYQRLQS